jgi:hypothetical protein
VLDADSCVDEAQAIDVFLQQVCAQVRAAHRCVSTPGFVNDLAAVCRDASVVISPQLNGGSSIKVLEAMGRGRSCVVSGLGANAFADRFAYGREFLVARTALARIDHIPVALRQPTTLQVMGDRVQAPLLQVFSSTGPQPPGHRADWRFARAFSFGP